MKIMKKLWITCGLLLALAAHAEDEGMASKVGNGIKKGAEATGKGIEKGVEATGRGVNKGVEATSRVFKKAGDWVEGKLGSASGVSKPKER